MTDKWKNMEINLIAENILTQVDSEGYSQMTCAETVGEPW